MEPQAIGDLIARDAEQGDTRFREMQVQSRSLKSRVKLFLEKMCNNFTSWEGVYVRCVCICFCRLVSGSPAWTTPISKPFALSTRFITGLLGRFIL